jgi:serine/threonine protein phosphatase 1
MMVESWYRFQERQNLRTIGALSDWFSSIYEPLSPEERSWLGFGGRETLASYAAGGGTGKLSDVPAAHWDFLEKTLVNWYETERHIFVHACANPDLPLSEQPETMLHWEKMITPRAHTSGKILVCGHTAQKSGKPRNWGHTICIDTWVYGCGWLTCLDVDTGQFWQANQQGETETTMIGLPHW